MVKSEDKQIHNKPNYVEGGDSNAEMMKTMEAKMGLIKTAPNSI